jgi:hypothetical protein
MAVGAATAPAPSDLAWRVIGLNNLYRLLIPPVLLTMQQLSTNEYIVRAHNPSLFTSVCVGYFIAGVLLVLARRLTWPSLRMIALANATVDAIGITLILYSSAGVQSGLGILLVLPVGTMALLAEAGDAFLIAAMAALGVLAQQIAVIACARAKRWCAVRKSIWRISRNSRNTSCSICARACSSWTRTIGFA